MKKGVVFVSLITSLFFSGCASIFDGTSRYINPSLKQLKGQHISLVIDRIKYFPHVDIGMLSNKYYIYKECEYKGDNITYNGYGVILSRQPIYHCGNMHFVTDKDGFIKDYVEEGYRYHDDYQKYFKDLIIIKR